MNRLIRIGIFSGVLGALFLVGFLAAQWIPFLFFPSNDTLQEKMFRVKWGEPFEQVARRLAEEGFVPQSRRFIRLANFMKVAQKTQAGAYMLNGKMTPLQILEHLSKGKVVKFKVTVPEGYNMYQIARLLEEGQVVPTTDFLAAASDAPLLTELGITGPTAEGYLYPETYLFSSSLAPRDVVRMMVGQFRKVFDEGMVSRMKVQDITEREVITLASIVEKESSVAEERPLVSAVFHNRLKFKMRLQSDPTVIYGLLPDFNGNLTRVDLETDGLYNTYTRSGLPPGPIANPGRESLIAALYPAPVNHIYFVSKNDGTHIFSNSYKEHSRNVWKYQKSNPGQAETIGVR